MRVASESIDDEQLREDFVQRIADNEQGVPQDFVLAGNRSRFALYNRWFEQLEEEFDVKRLDQEFFQPKRR